MSDVCHAHRGPVATLPAWALRKANNRLQRQLERKAQAITTGRGGISTARALGALATRVIQGLPAF